MVSMKNTQQVDPRFPQSATLHGVGVALMAAAMTLPLAAPVQAESAPEQGQISLKYLDYLDSQPGDPRIRVRATALGLSAPISGDWLIGGTLTSDGISGASPAYHSSGLSQMREHRRAIDAQATRYFSNATVTFGASVSSESDYLSRGLSLQATRSSESKNTSWSAGLGLSSDIINPSNGVVDHAGKHVFDLLVGVTQVMTPSDIVKLDLGMSWGSGYLSDPYKVFDERPSERRHTTLMVRWNRYLASTDGTLRSSYRYYTDSWDIKSHTLGLEYVQPLSNNWTLTPLARFYSQSAAIFYVDADPSTEPFPPNPPADAVNYSEDQRLSAFGAVTLGLKLSKRFNADWLVDVKAESYRQRADWRLFGNGSPGLAPFNARSIQLGLSRQF